MANFTHLHVHTDYSILDGAGRIKDYVAKCKEFGMTSLAITDHGNMFGSYEFYHVCRKEGIKPIVGCEFYVAENDISIKDNTNNVRNHLILLARNDEGFRNLLKLASIAYTKGFYMKPRVDKSLLEKYHEGIACMSACIAGEIPRLIYKNFAAKKKDLLEGVRETCRWYENLYGKGNYFLEIQRHFNDFYDRLSEYDPNSDEYESIIIEKTVNKELIRLSKELGIPLVATNDAHYVDRADAEAQDVLVSIGTGKTIKDPKRFKFFGDSFYLKTPEEMRLLFSDIPEVVDNSALVDEICQLEIKYPGPRLPVFDIPKGFKDNMDYLSHIANEGLKERYGNPPAEYQERLDYELSVINETKFPGYFLIVWDYVHWAKTHGVPVGPGRGSGAGSIVAYCLGITDIDPMKYGLMFERFLNKDRISLPDFDIDFCADKRQQVIDYVTEKYGSDKVGQICTFGTLKAKQCITDVARVLDIPLYEVNAMKKIIIDDLDLEFEWLLNGHTRKDGSKYAKNEDFLKFRDKGPEYEKLFEIVPKLEGMVRNVSLHAAGVVIGETELFNYVPLYYDIKSGLTATQYPMTQIEECGLVKMDFLGLKTLTLLAHAVDFVRLRKPDFDLEKIQDGDEAAVALFSRGDTACVFQFESSGMRSILKGAKPRNIKELAALNALYRPGPMANIPQYIESKSDEKKIKYPFPELEEVLKETFGVIVYQEQVMRISSVFAGYSNGKADILRKIMGKKQKEKLEGARKEFIECAVRDKDRKKEDAERLFDLLEPFAGYGFNKSHAVGYAFLAYQAGYLKAHYPVEFMAANLLMAAKDANPDKLPETLMSTREMGIEILAADVNISEKTFSVSDGKIIYGLSGLKNVGEKFVDNIIEERRKGGKYTDLVDFLTRLDSKTTNQRIVMSLIEGGAMDSLGLPRETMEYNYKRACTYIEKETGKKGEYAVTDSLFMLDDSEENKEILGFKYLEPPEMWTKQEKLRKEWDILGTYVSGHPLDEYKNQISRCIRYTLADAKGPMPDGTTFNLICIVTKVTEMSTKTGKLMGKLNISDYTSSAELMVWSRDWDSPERGIKGLVSEMGIYCLEITKKDDGDRTSLIFKSLKDIDSLQEAKVNVCRVVLENTQDKDSLVMLKDFLKVQSGGVKVTLVVGSGRNEKEYKTSYSIDDNDEVFEEITRFPCVQSCRLV
ncbi:MAG TPA: DNA polymerase III subunit alpha [Spirochaetaceae bacterium]|nr:DNA polymerase III subunit alpha [Spirochaetaceae bacterium]